MHDPFRCNRTKYFLNNNISLRNERNFRDNPTHTLLQTVDVAKFACDLFYRYQRSLETGSIRNFVSARNISGSYRDASYFRPSHIL